MAQSVHHLVLNIRSKAQNKERNWVNTSFRIHHLIIWIHTSVNNDNLECEHRWLPGSYIQNTKLLTFIVSNKNLLDVKKKHEKCSFKKFKFADTSMLYWYYESVGKIVMKIRLRTENIHVNLKSIKVTAQMGESNGSSELITILKFSQPFSNHY